MKTNVTCCARCGYNHQGVEFQKLTRNVDGLEATHWAPCPTNGQPILMTMVVTPEPPTLLDGKPIQTNRKGAAFPDGDGPHA